MDWNSLSFLLLIFTSVTVFLFGLTHVWNVYWGNKSSTIKRRLRSISGEIGIDSQSLLKTRYLSQWNWLQALLNRIPHVHSLDAFLTQAGMAMSIAQYAFCQLVLGAVSIGLILWMGWGVAVAMVLSPLPTVLWLMYLQYKRQARVVHIESQLPDTLDLMSRAMQAGHAFSSALLIVGSDGTQPIKGEFQTTFDEINFGIPTNTALLHLTQRVASRDLRFFVVAVLIQLETGGNLTEILKSLAELIRDRQRIAGNVRVLSAEGRLSAWILGLLPIVIAVLLSIINPEFIEVLWTDAMGIFMLQISVGLIVIGALWMWNMVRIRI